MSLKPFEMLEGTIDRIKEVQLADGMIERWYEDDNGDRAILVLSTLESEREKLVR